VRPRHEQLFVIAGTLLIVSGCARQLVKTKMYPGTLEDTGMPPSGAEGTMTYYLPKNLLKLKLSRALAPSKTVEKAMAAARQAIEKAEATKKKAEASEEEAKQAETLATNAQGTAVPVTRTQADVLRTKAKTDQDAAQKAAQAAKQAEAQAVAAAAAEGTSLFVDDISLAVLPPVPDTRKLFSVDLNHVKTADDDLKIVTSENGLLQSIDITAVDRVPDIIQSLVETAINIAKLSVGGLPALGTGLAAAAPTDQVLCLVGKNKQRVSEDIPAHVTLLPGIERTPFEIERIFSPEVDGDLDALNLELCRLGTPFEIEVVKEPPTGNITDAEKFFGKKKTWWWRDEEAVSGLIYRRPITYQINFRKKLPVSVNGVSQYRTYVLRTTHETLLNDGPLAVLPLEAGAFVRTDYKVVFKNGVLTENKATRPSEGVGLVSIPFRIVERAVRVPTELLQFKIDISNKETELLQSEKQRLEAKKLLQQEPAKPQPTAEGAGVAP